jgi:uridylate kinase
MSGIPNSLALLETLNSKGVDTRMMCAFEIHGIARHFDPFKARKLLQEGKLVICTGGTGEAFFTHDTAAVVRALEIKADVLLKATNVDGVYSEDPHKNPNARKYERITYAEAVEKHLDILDQTAFALARDNFLKIIVFKWELGSLASVLKNPLLGTVIS